MSPKSRSQQKGRERFFTEEAAKNLGKEWCLGLDRERPDFIITEGEKRFGLEVTYLFAGPIDKHGSHRKKVESYKQKIVNNLRDKYEEYANTPLEVKLVGDLCLKNVDEVVSILLGLSLSTKPIGHQDRFEVDKGLAKLSVYATRAIRANWYYVNHRVGWVDRKPLDRINAAIEDKAKKLQEYRTHTNLDDIRLLIVADRRMDSGKLSLEGAQALDLRGFQIVYFYSYPDDPIEICPVCT